MGAKEKSKELRKQKRFNVQYGSVAALENRSGSGVRVGLITNLSKNGLSFCYIDHNNGDEENWEGSSELKISLNIENFFLGNVPCEIISDQVITKISSCRCFPPMKRCGIQFRDLSSDQASRLEDFLEGFTEDSGGEADK